MNFSVCSVGYVGIQAENNVRLWVAYSFSYRKHSKCGYMRLYSVLDAFSLNLIDTRLYIWRFMLGIWQGFLLSNISRQTWTTYYIQPILLNSDTLIPITFSRKKRRKDFVQVQLKISSSFLVMRKGRQPFKVLYCWELNELQLLCSAVIGADRIISTIDLYRQVSCVVLYFDTKRVNNYRILY